MKTKAFVATGVLLLSLAVSPAAFAQGTDSVPPSDVEKVPTVLAVGNGQVQLQWDVATDNVGVTGYKVYYSPNSMKAAQNSNAKGSYDTFVKVDNVNQKVMIGLTNGTKYYFSITAVDAAGNESEYYSPEAEATPLATAGDLLAQANMNATSVVSNTNLNATTAVQNTNTNSPVGSVLPELTNFVAKEIEGKVTLTWTPSSLASVVDQLLYVSKDAGKTYDAGVHVANGTHTMTTVEPSTSYTFKLTTKDLNGAESVGVTTTLTTSASTSALPSLKDVSSLVSKFQRVASKFTVTLSWTLPQDVANVVSQIVYQSLDGTVFKQLASLGSNITTYDVKGLNPGKYFFKITTKDKAGKESAGVIKMVELPTTGPAIALIGLISLGGTAIFRKKKKLE